MSTPTIEQRPTGWFLTLDGEQIHIAPYPTYEMAAVQLRFWTSPRKHPPIGFGPCSYDDVIDINAMDELDPIHTRPTDLEWDHGPRKVWEE